ncbi:hypothetical protein IID19_03315, partial [Patescibacteria group bacterium]|nr:hypothetical protein [Patescibacteria group bacterium]
MVWSTFLTAIILTLVAPLWAIYFIILFDLYWLLRILYMLYFIITSFRRFRRTIKVDWLAKVQTLPGWEEHYHLIFIPTYKESYDILRHTIEALVLNKYPLDKFIVVLAGEEKDKHNFLAMADRLT